MTRTITVDVYAPDGVTHEGTLASDSQREWLDDLSAEGSYGLEVKVGHADEALLALDRIVRFSVSAGARWQGLVEDLSPVAAEPSRRQSGRVMKAAGRGTLALLERAAVYPELGLGRISPDIRYFNFASLDYDDSGWTTATELKTQSDTDPTKPWYRAPKGWKDPDAVWIGPTGGDIPPVAPGNIYFRGTFTIAAGEGGDYRFMFTADDGFELYLDGNKIASEQKAGLWGVARTYDALLDEGSHLVAVKLINFDRPVAATNVTGLIISVFKLLGGGVAVGNVVARTSAGTSMLAFPSVAPGMTPGKILDVLLTETQARGTLTELSWDFTATLDSNGTAWPEEIDEAFQVGTSVLEIVRHLVEEKKLDVAMSATGLTLHAYVTKGSDLSGTVSAEYGVNVGRLAFKKTAATANVTLSRTAESRWWETIEATSVDDFGRREIGLSLGSAPSDDASTRQATAFFAEHAYPTTAVTDLQLEAVSAVPGVDFTTGDTIDCLGDPYRVKSLRTSEDAAGQPVYTPELLAV